MGGLYVKSPILSTDDMKEYRPMQKHQPPVVTGSKTVFECPYYSVRHDELDLPNGTKGNYYVIDMPEAAGVIAISEGKILMISQYRHPLAIVTYEFPMGRGHKGEPPQDAALREFAEETGFAPVTVKPLCVIDPLPGQSNHQVAMFIAEGVRNTTAEKDAEEYDLEKHWFTPEQIDEMIASGRMNNAVTIAAWYKYKLTF
jgi:8-oxo-dGTP pyrophosphatase MutT (NUDIX family)